MGPRTRAAIRAYQRKAGLPVDGVASKEVLDHMKRFLLTVPERILDHEQVVRTAKDINAGCARAPIVRPQLQTKRAFVILVSSPANLTLRFDPCGDLRILIRIDEADRIAVAVCNQNTFSAQPACMESPAFEFKPALFTGERFDPGLLGYQPR